MPFQTPSPSSCPWEREPGAQLQTPRLPRKDQGCRADRRSWAWKWDRPGNEGQKGHRRWLQGVSVAKFTLQTTEMDSVTQNKKVILESTLILSKKKKTSKKAEEEKEKVIFTGDTSNYRKSYKNRTLVFYNPQGHKWFSRELGTDTRAQKQRGEMLRAWMHCPLRGADPWPGVWTQHHRGPRSPHRVTLERRPRTHAERPCPCTHHLWHWIWLADSAQTFQTGDIRQDHQPSLFKQAQATEGGSQGGWSRSKGLKRHFNATCDSPLGSESRGQFGTLWETVITILLHLRLRTTVAAQG